MSETAKKNIQAISDLLHQASQEIASCPSMPMRSEILDGVERSKKKADEILEGKNRES